MTTTSIAHHRIRTNPRSADGRRILNAIDREAMHESIVARFATGSVEVLTTTDDQVAIRLRREHHLDLLLVVHMLVLDCSEFFERVFRIILHLKQLIKQLYSGKGWEVEDNG